jgi:transposase-like protein
MSGRDTAKCQQWQQILQQWAQSGMSQAEFCRQHQLRENRFTYWKIALLSEGGSQKKKKKAKAVFLPVVVTSESGKSNYQPSNIERQISVEPGREKVAAEISSLVGSNRMMIIDGASPETIAAIIGVCFR